ncbi:MAG: ribosome biogenesis GTPase Der [Miltoncostaeaceae bacterium]
MAIVGFPNVGKSTLFNRLTGRKEAVVDPVPGVTRDRRSAGTDWNGRAFQIVDTGGIDEEDASDVGRLIAAQAARAAEDADLILLVLDATTAPTPGDLELIERLRSRRSDLMLVANKCDDQTAEAAAHNLATLGMGPVYPVSATHGRGVGDLLDAVVDRLTDAPPADALQPDAVVRPPAVAIVGRPNVGKSSVLNALLGEERAVVHDVPGTTRDPVDTLIEVDGREVALIDTAGLRRRGRSPEVERASQRRSIDAARRSDVALAIVDATEGITEADLAALDQVVRTGCGSVVAVNKWDLAQPDLDDLRGRLHGKSRQRSPLEICSAVTGEGLHRLLPAALRVYERGRARLPTRALNEFLREIAEERPGPRRGRARLSLRHLIQTAEGPPRFRLEVNDPALVTRDYGYWIENRLRRRFDLEGVPVDIDVRARSGGKGARR